MANYSDAKYRFFYDCICFLSSLKDIKRMQLFNNRILYFILSFLLFCCNIIRDDPF